MTKLDLGWQNRDMFRKLLSSPPFSLDERLRFRLFLSHSILAAIFLFATTAIFYAVARYALIERAHRQLESVMNLKKLRIEGYFSSLNQYVDRVSKKVRTVSELKSELAHSPFQSDLFRLVVFGPGNQVVFDSFPEEVSPEQTGPDPSRLRSGVVSTDTKCHTGVKLIPCLWLQNSSALGQIAFKVRLQGIYGFLATQNGLGETGESYLIGADGVFRSPSRFLSEDVAFKTLVKSPAVELALSGKTGHTLGPDYRDQLVLSAFGAVQSTPWVILSEIDLEEVLLPLSLMKKVILVSVLIFFLAVLVVARFTSTSMAMPVEKQIRAFQTDIVNQRLHQRALYEGQERERSRFAAELHDGLGQELTALSLQVAAAEWDLAAKQSLQANISRIAQELRRISSNLVPLELDKLGLAGALQQLTNEVERASKIKFHLLMTDFPTAIPTTFSLHLYRIAQEAVQNVIRHSAASECRIHFFATADSLSLCIADNGGPASFEHKGQGIGHMRQRAEALGGTFSIRSSSNGTVVEVSIPLNSMEAALNA